MYRIFIILLAIFVFQAGVVHAADDEVRVSLKNGKLQFATEDDRFSMRIGGRMQVDTALYFDDKTDLGNGSEVRRARLFVSGDLWHKRWQSKVQYDFAGSGDDDVKDVYLRWNHKPWSITVGHFEAPLSLEKQTSSKNITFMERSLPDNLLITERNIGLMAALKRNNWTAAVAVFDNNQGDADKGVDFVARATADVLHGQSAGQVLHLGASGLYRSYPGQEGVPRIRARPESHITGIRLVDTGNIDNVDSATLYGVEAAWVYDRLMVAGEYQRLGLDREGRQGINRDGGYLEASFFLTDDRVQYKNGKFDAVRPGSVVGNGGIGAWQVAARLSRINLSDGRNIVLDDKGTVDTADDVVDMRVDGGEQTNLGLALNAYLTPTIRFSANYIKGLEVKGGGNAGEEPSLLQFRVQLVF